MVELPKIFRNIPNVSAADLSFRKQNLMALLCSIKSEIVKIEKHKFGKHKYILLIMTLTWNLAQMLLIVVPTHENLKPRSFKWLFSHSSKSERCRRTSAYICQTNKIILIKFWHVLHNEMINLLQFTDLKNLEIWPFYRYIKFEQFFGQQIHISNFLKFQT